MFLRWTKESPAGMFERWMQDQYWICGGTKGTLLTGGEGAKQQRINMKAKNVNLLTLRVISIFPLKILKRRRLMFTFQFFEGLASYSFSSWLGFL